MITNNEFLTALFAEDAPWVHVTDFPYDPSNIPKEQHLTAWKGDYFSRYTIGVNTNQYFTISNFYCDEQGTARRRKALFRHTRVIVLDDVKEKLSLEEVKKLPSPAWILETSSGSEQWGYILDKPCDNRSMVENLLDGLVANGLAPDGKDPGMKGVTRYVRLPEGVNNKASKLVNGQPFKCQLTLWQPFNRVTIEQLAAPFHVDLHAVRRESRVDGAADVSDHPLLKIPHIIKIKEIRSDGRFDITCPWVDEHTNADDSGSAIFTNKDGSIGFKCHHGACQDRTGTDLLRVIEQQQSGFGVEFAGWKAVRAFETIEQTPVAPISFIEPQQQSNGLQTLIDQLRRERPDTDEARKLSSQILKAVEDMPEIEKIHWHDQVCDLMHWTKQQFKTIIKDLRKTWYSDSKSSLDFFNDVVFVAEQNQFFDRKKRIFYSAEAYQNTYAHKDAEARKIALQDGRVIKVDRIDYAPKKPTIFEENGIKYANSWCNTTEVKGVTGDVSRWLEHFDVLGWGESREHVMQWMAFTLLHPDQKINHMLLFGSGEGCGKDWLLYPLIKGMGDHSLTISGEELLEGFNDYILSTKHLHINEAELGDRKEAIAIGAKLKPLAAAPPDKLRVNQKSIKPISVRNILNLTMTTNSQMPFRLNGPSRRIYALWSDIQTRDDSGNVTAEWQRYWDDRWEWMRNGGVDAVIHYLRNCVDLSQFNPASPPPMTQFLRDIQESSKSPMLQTLESFIRHRVGNFKSDILTAADITATLKAGEMLAPELMYCESRYFNPTKVGLLMKEVNGVFQMHVHKNRTSARLWVFRNVDQYKLMSPVDLFNQYEQQMKNSKSNPLTVVS